MRASSGCRSAVAGSTTLLGGEGCFAGAVALVGQWVCYSALHALSRSTYSQQLALSNGRSLCFQWMMMLLSRSRPERFRAFVSAAPFSCSARGTSREPMVAALHPAVPPGCISFWEATTGFQVSIEHWSARWFWMFEMTEFREAGVEAFRWNMN